MKKHYLADTLRIILEGLSPADQKLLSAPVVRYKQCLAEAILRDAELYTFDRSALDMAGSLKIGDPAELHRVLRSVLKGPRRTVFLETDGLERAEALTHLRRTVIRELTDREAIPTRVGILLEILGDGRARYRPIWTHGGPNSELRKLAQSLLRESKRHGMMPTALQKQAFRDVICLNVNAGWRIIDPTNEPCYPSISEFSRMAQSGEGDADRYLAGAMAQEWQEVFSQPLSHDDILKIAWWSYCLHQMEQPQFDFDSSDQQYLDELNYIGMPRAQIARDMQRNCDGELTNVAAMLSVLAVENNADKDPIVSVEERPAQPQLVKSPRNIRHIQRDRLRVVSHNVSGIEPYHIGGASAGMVRQTSGNPRALHFVNGHLFLARNGKMTWRRSHWRGSEAPAPVLTRVR